MQRTIVASILAGVLFALALPPYDLSLLGVVALALLLYTAASLSRRPLHAAGTGLLTGVVCGLTQIGFPSGQSGTMFGYGLAPFLFLSVVFVTVSTLAAWGRLRFAASPQQWVLFVACAAVCVEFAMTWTPLPVTVALTMHKGVPTLQPLISTTGLLGVSFLMWLLSAAGAALFLATDAAQRKRAWHTAYAAFALIIGVVTFGCIAGLVRGDRAGDYKEAGQLRVAAVQDYIAPGELRESDALRADLTKEARRQGAELVVWAETSEGYAFEPDDAESPAYKVARDNDVLLAVGYLQPRPRKDGYKDMNRAALISPTGDTLGIHTKNALFLGERTTVQAGQGVAVVKTEQANVGLLICFDTCYPHLPRMAVQRGAQILAVPNHDPMVPRHVLHYLHAALMPFRASENGVPIVRADDAGLSHIIWPDGWVAEQAGMDRAATVVSDVPLGSGKGTIYTRFGDWFAALCFIGFAALVTNSFVVARKAKPAVATTASTTTPEAN